MKILVIFNREPYDSTDVTWNGLRLADTLLKNGHEVRIFLMNDSVDMARDVCKPPEGNDQDLSHMLKELIAKGVAWPVAVFTKTILILTGRKSPPCRHFRNGSSTVTGS